MSDFVSRHARRRFLKLAMAGVAATPLSGGLVLRRAGAQQRVEEDDPLAQQLGYVHDAADVDPSAWPSYEEGQLCANCALFHGQEGEEWGPCDIFGGRLVNANGWCSAWAPREA